MPIYYNYYYIYYNKNIRRYTYINVYLYKYNYYFFFLYKCVIEYWSLDSDYCNTILKHYIKLHIIELSILFARQVHISDSL